eukprot:1831713-Rhodomonas_salina.7
MRCPVLRWAMLLTGVGGTCAVPCTSCGEENVVPSPLPALQCLDIIIMHACCALFGIDVWDQQLMSADDRWNRRHSYAVTMQFPVLTHALALASARVRTLCEKLRIRRWAASASGTVLRLRYAMSGTDKHHAAARWQRTRVR